jgi:hypothetical protein
MSRTHSWYSASKLRDEVFDAGAMVRAALMRVRRWRAVIITVLAAALLPVAAHAAPRGDGRGPWATVNVCDTGTAPDTIGIRASMPGSRSGQEDRFMRFVVQYWSRADERWHRIAAAGDSGYLAIGKGRGTRQFGRSFRIEPTRGQPVLLRGRVYFQWRLKGDVTHRTSAVTRRGHRSSAGDDPPGYSASTCTITADG